MKKQNTEAFLSNSQQYAYKRIMKLSIRSWPRYEVKNWLEPFYRVFVFNEPLPMVV